MILNKEEKQIELQSNTIFEGHDAKISEEDIHKLWSMLQDPYKNSIGAIVREISSNSFDAIAEIGVTDAVHIKIGKDDTGHYWSAEDFGVGLSPDRMQNIYINYLKSTKEHSNELIGHFGIGSKSPLSYTDLFYIRTRFDGIEYNYILRKGEKTPRLEKIFEEPTTERNGTLIKIYIKTNKSKWYPYEQVPEIHRFEEECKKQLCYFDNIYFDNCGVDNNYKIIEGKHWKYNTHVNPFDSLHLCLGKVAYPIDWNNLGIDQIRLQVALKFDIGELDIIPTREDIKYTPKTKEAVLNKIKLLKEEFTDIWNKQDFELDDIYKYKDLTRVHCYNIKLSEVNFDLEKLFDENEIKQLDYFVYKPLENWYIPNNFFFGYKTNRRLGAQGRILKIANYQWDVTNLLERNSNQGYRIQGETDTKTNKYIYYLDTKQKGNTVYFIEKNNDIKLSQYVSFLRLPTTLNKKEKLLKIIQYQKAIEVELNKITKSYKDVVIDPEWLMKEKENNQRKKVPKEIIVTQRYDPLSKEWDRFECNLNKVGDELILIGTKEQHKHLVFWNSIINTKYLDLRNNKHFKTLIVAKTNFKKFKEIKNVWTIERIMSEESKIFKRVVTAYKVCKEDQFILKLNSEDYIDIYKPIAEDINVIQTLVKDWSHNNSHSENKFIKENCVAIAEEHNLYDQNILDIVQRIKDYFEGLEILQFINPEIKDTGEYDEEGNKITIRKFPVRETAKYIYNINRNRDKKKFKRLNAYYYCNFNQEELKWKTPTKIKA